MNRRQLTTGLQLSVRAAIGAGVSLFVAQLLALEFPIYAFLAAVIVTDLSPSRTRKLGLQRVLATLLGAALGATLSATLPAAPWALGLGILVTMLASHLVGMPDSAKVAGYICGIAMLYHGFEPWKYAFFRLVETLLGVAVAWTISLVPKLIRVEEPAGEDR